MKEKIRKFNEIELGDVIIYLVERKKLNEYILTEYIEQKYKPIFRTDCVIHIGQIIVQYDENNNITNEHSLDIITEIAEYVKGDKIAYYVFYIMDINDWIDSRLEEMPYFKISSTIDLYRDELEKLRNFKKQIDSTSIREVKESFINDYFELAESSWKNKIEK